MRRAPDSLGEMVSAFRDLTGASSDGAATRARVLATAARALGHRATLRRLRVAIAATVVALSSASAALTVGRRWRSPPATPLDARERDGDGGGATSRADGRATRVIPAAIATLAPRADVDGDEARAYGRAHQAHFVDDAPARALAAWDAYLAAFPRGAFAPEAAYNRAICLVRLGRRAAAAAALRPFSEAPSPGYRRAEARQLLDWLASRQVR